MSFSARFAHALSGLGGYSRLIQVASAAGIEQELVSARGSHRAVTRHAALVNDGRCLKQVCVGVARMKQRALKARNVGDGDDKMRGFQKENLTWRGVSRKFGVLREKRLEALVSVYGLKTFAARPNPRSLVLAYVPALNVWVAASDFVLPVMASQKPHNAGVGRSFAKALDNQTQRKDEFHTQKAYEDGEKSQQKISQDEKIFVGATIGDDQPECCWN